MPSDARLLLLDKNEVEALLLHDDVLRAVREAFVLHSQGEGRVFPLVREPLITGGRIRHQVGGCSGARLARLQGGRILAKQPPAWR